MPLPPMLAQTLSIIPPELVQLGTAGIIAAALFGVVYAIKPLIGGFVSGQKELANVNRELLTALKESNRAQDRASDVQERVSGEMHEVKTALTTQTEALAVLIKGQPEVIAQVIKSADRVVGDVNEAADKRGAEMNAGIARVEVQIAALRDEIMSGNKAHRQEMLGKLNEILHEIASLKPPPPPVVLKHPEPLEPKKEAAA